MTRRRRPAREVVIDAALVGGCAFVAVALAGDAEPSGWLSGRDLFSALVLALVGCAVLWWRRGRPVAVAIALALIAAASPFTYGAVLVAVYTVAVRCRLVLVLAVAAVHLVAPVPYTVLLPNPEVPLLAATAVNGIALAAAVAVGSVVRSVRQRAETLRERARQAEQEAASQAERLRALERNRIAREMHDVLAHRISLVSLHAGALEIRPDLPTEQVARAAATIRASAHQALEDLREILGVLRAGEQGPGLRPQPGVTDLDTLVNECRTAGTPIVFVDALAGDVPPPSGVSRTVYRLVQEGLTNARKHAPRAPVHILLDRTAAGELHVSLRNPLVSAAGQAIPGTRTGLVGLAERVSLVGGRFEHGVRRGPDGTPAFHLEAWLPWPT